MTIISANTARSIIEAISAERDLDEDEVDLISIRRVQSKWFVKWLVEWELYAGDDTDHFCGVITPTEKGAWTLSNVAKLND